MNYQQARIFIMTAAIIVVLLICGLILRPLINSKPEPIDESSLRTVGSQNELPLSATKTQTIRSLHIDQKVGNLAKQFNDLNDAHLVFAQKIGIKPIDTTRDIMRLRTPLVHVKSGKNYVLDRLSHSYPYLVEPAAELLDTIGARFNRKLNERGGGDYMLKVTSLLRTRESIKRLQHGNVNSTSNSAHLYGSTFDISYVDFNEKPMNIRKLNDGQLKNLLAEVLLELRSEGKCLVKFERKQGCFHITATGK